MPKIDQQIEAERQNIMSVEGMEAPQFEAEKPKAMEQSERNRLVAKLGEHLYWKAKNAGDRETQEIASMIWHLGDESPANLEENRASIQRLLDSLEPNEKPQLQDKKTS